MSASAILALVAQAVGLLPTLISTGVDVYHRIQQIKQLAEAGATGTATEDQIKAVRDQLDADLADFNEPI